MSSTEPRSRIQLGYPVQGLCLLGSMILGLVLGGCSTPQANAPASASDSPTQEQLEPPDPDRPSPPVPEKAILLGKAANVELLISADRSGHIEKVEISRPSKVKVLDEYTRGWVEQHWRMPPAKPDEPEIRKFIAPIVYPEGTGAKGGKYPPPDYPEYCLRRHIQGLVGLRIDVDDAGKIISTSILASSGSQILDAHTQSWVKRHWIFPPGKERQVYWVCRYEIVR